MAEETNEKSKSLSIEEALNDNSSINVADVVNENSVDNDMASNTINSRPNNQGGQDKNEQDPVGTMERIPVGNVLTALNNKQLEPISSPTFRPDNEQSANNDSQVLASVSLTGEMENPIEPITNFIAKKTRTDIDFKRTKKDADPKDGKGFFIKIGKFELSRKKH